ncbi:hypothetical protein BJ741DRAFT_586939 [Chytriomyces cf. hyalinus JEL632]|nr:hypothetical protein BJ741DRAFT_586939 [Chytriomyces cf. hyalinus JEL632]
MVDRVENGFDYFGISGTTGTGKSSFFIYILHLLMNDWSLQPRPKLLNLTRVLYQTDSAYVCFDLQTQTVFQVAQMQTSDIISDPGTL